MIIPDVVLQRVLVAGFQAIKKDPRVLDGLFRSADPEWRSRMKKFILENAIDYTFNYPREGTLKIPALVFILKGESEAQTFLGDSMGEYPNYGVPDQELVVDTLGGHGASTTTVQGLPRAVVQGLAVVDSFVEGGVHKVRLSDADDNLETYYEVFSDRDTYESMTLYVVKGRGAGQKLQITAMEDNVLDLSGVLDPYLDSSSVVDIRLTHDHERSVGQPPRVYDPTEDLIRTGANFEAQYQITILAGTPDETIYLYSVLKAILFSQKAFMEEQGLMAAKIQGSDLTPRQDGEPSAIYQRSMTLSFTYPFAFLETRTDTFGSIDFALAVRNALTGVCERLELVGSI